MDIVYKVVRRLSADRIVSAIIKDPEIMVIYKAHETISGTVGPILAFREHEQASNFAFGNYLENRQSSFEVWECHANVIRPVYTVIEPHDICTYTSSKYGVGILSAIKSFWNLNDWSRMPTGLAPISAPNGTVACEWIKLIRHT